MGAGGCPGRPTRSMLCREPLFSACHGARQTLGWTKRDHVAAQQPQVLNANPDDFVEARFLRDLQASGYFDRLGR